MVKKVDPPKPLTLLSLMTFIVVAGSVFIIIPVVAGLLSIGIAAVELMLSANNVSGDFSNVIIGSFLWGFAHLPFDHWIVASVLVVVVTALFVVFTHGVNKE